MENQIHASPGVYFRIIDYSSYSVMLTSTSLALAGTAKKGPTTPVQIQTINQFTSVFGTPRTTDFSCFTALSYLEFSSNLWFCRIVGDNAKKSTVDIPSARYIENERLTTTQSFNRYIYSGRLNEVPIANTVQLYLHNPDNANTGVMINANRDGRFYNADSSSMVFQYPYGINMGILTLIPVRIKIFMYSTLLRIQRKLSQYNLMCRPHSPTLA